jgi:hypothetical protein
MSAQCVCRSWRDACVVVAWWSSWTVQLPSITKAENVRYELVRIEVRWNEPRCERKKLFVKRAATLEHSSSEQVLSQTFLLRNMEFGEIRKLKIANLDLFNHKFSFFRI